MAMEWEKPDTVVKAIFIGMNGLLWLAFCFRIIKQWHTVSHSVHFWEIYLAAVFPLLWGSMIRDENTISSLTVASAVFLGVVTFFH